MKIKIIIVLLLIFIYSVTNILRLDWIEILELKSLDFRYRIRGDISTKTDIVILSVDENSLINFETELNEAWPWQRRYHGKAVQLLFDNGAKAVGFDISFTSNDRINIKNDTYLGSIIRKYGNVVLGTYAISDKTIYDNYSDSYKQYLFENTDYLNTKLKIKEINFRSNLIPMEKYKLIPPVKELASSSYPAIYEVGNLDVDGVLRNVPLIYKEKWAEENGFGDIFLPHMDLLLFNAFNGNYENIIDLKKLEINTSERNIKIDQNGIFQIFFYGHGPQVFETVSFYDLINGNFNKDIFKDKLVLVGFTSSSVGLYDLRIT
ncbi:MAG TPA: CHASE2 domain-containing protein, partial [Tepiditoga sp.]|nr:CHASE2 domain-containing protein [Tepiditoga sp.]